MSQNYDINSIQSLDFRTGVRTRIQMYLGSNDIDGTYQAFKEIINNSTDEALAGFGTKIEINVDEQENLARQFQIMSIPTLIIFKNGSIAKSFIGVQDKKTLLAELK